MFENNPIFKENKTKKKSLSTLMKKLVGRTRVQNLSKNYFSFMAVEASQSLSKKKKKNPASF